MTRRDYFPHMTLRAIARRLHWAYSTTRRTISGRRDATLAEVVAVAAETSRDIGEVAIDWGTPALREVVERVRRSR